MEAEKKKGLPAGCGIEQDNGETYGSEEENTTFKMGRDCSTRKQKKIWITQAYWDDERHYRRVGQSRPATLNVLCIARLLRAWLRTVVATPIRLRIEGIRVGTPLSSTS